MTEKEEGEDIEDLLMKNIYNEKEIEDYTGIKIYKNQDYLSLKNYYKEKFHKSINKEFSLHKKRIHCMDWLENNSGTLLVTGSSDNSIKIWDINNSLNSRQNISLNPLLSINSHTETIINVTSRNNHENQFISSSADKHIKFWDIRSNISNNNNNKINICRFSSDKNMKDEIKHLKFNNSGSQFALINKEGNNIILYDLGKMEEIQQFSFKSTVYDFIFDKNDNRIFVTSEDGYVYIINIKINNNNRINIQGSLFPLSTIDIDKNNKFFVTGGNDGILIGYSVDELMCCKTYKRSEQGIRQVMYNYDDKFIATIYDGKHIDFFSTELDDHIYTIFTSNSQYFIKWNKKRNILAYVGDEKEKKNEDSKNMGEGSAHFFIMPNI